MIHEGKLKKPRRHTVKPHIIPTEIKTKKRNTMTLGEQNNIRYIERIIMPDGRFMGVQSVTTMLRGEKQAKMQVF